MFVDATKRKLRVPDKYLPYLDKYRLYELFHELGRELVIKQPDDHLTFMIDALTHAAHTCNVKKIILYAPPFIDLTDVAKEISKKFNVKIFTRAEVEKIIKPLTPDVNNVTDKGFAKCTKQLISLEHSNCSQGWLFINFPETSALARRFQRIGILPTHVIHLVPHFQKPLLDKELNKMPPDWIKYRVNLNGLRNTFASNWIDISLSNRDSKQLTDISCKLLEKSKRLGALRIPRVCLIGEPGSGCKTVAKSISDKLGLVHVHFPLLVKQAYILNESKEARILVDDKNLMESKSSRIRSELLFKKLLETDTVDKGWFVTGYPVTLLDMKRFDRMDTPPNRVIFFECPKEICLNRLNHPPPKNYCNITNIQEIKDYCDKTAYFIDASKNLDDVLNEVLAIIMGSLPEAVPRNPGDPEDCGFVSYDIPPTNDPCLFKIKQHKKVSEGHLIENATRSISVNLQERQQNEN